MVYAKKAGAAVMDHRGRSTKGHRRPFPGGYCILVVWICVFGQAWSAPFDLIVCGSGGEVEYEERFADWGGRLKRVLVEDLGHRSENVRLLVETGEDADGRSDLSAIRAAFEGLGKQVGERDDLFVYLIGHGSFRRKVAKLNIPGADLSADELDGLLSGISARRIVVVNGASASAAFINTLSGNGRIICTSTKSVDERYATQFMEYFIQALEEESADQNRDDRISVLEACQQAASLAEAWYMGAGLLSTEHGLLDDNGDGLGSRLLEGPEKERRRRSAEDGKLAANCFLKDFQFPPGASPEMIEAYRTILQEVERLVQKKTEVAPDVYDRDLEALLVKAARLHRRLRMVKQ